MLADGLSGCERVFALQAGAKYFRQRREGEEAAGTVLLPSRAGQVCLLVVVSSLCACVLVCANFVAFS